MLPNFAPIVQTVAEIWRLFDFSKMAAVCHLGFVMRVFGPPTEGVWWWSLSLCKIRSESTQQFLQYASLNILRVMPENAYSRTQSWGLCLKKWTKVHQNRR